MTPGESLEGVLLPAGTVAEVDPAAEPPGTVAVSLPELPGDIEVSEAVETEPVDVPLTARLEPGVAVLRVYRDALGDRFKVAGDCPELPLPDTVSARQGRPDVGLGALVVGGTGEHPVDVCARLHTWSESKTELVAWVNRLRLRFGDSFRLVIADQTGWEIPWELLRLPPDRTGELPAGWLGGIVPVSRRLTVEPDAPDKHTHGAHTCAGETVAFVDTDMTADGEALARYGAHQLPDIHDLLDILEDGSRQFGLIYLGCHGDFDPASGTAFRLAGRPHSDNGLVRTGVSVFELRRSTLAAVASGRPLVILNACHSARSVLDERNNDGTSHGFVRVFLEAGAAGVVGTVGMVGLHDARRVAEDLLRRLEQPGASIATALRDVRAVLAAREDALSHRQRRTDAGRDTVLSFLYGFMYVYFGHPDTDVRLSTVEPAGPG
ncbi:CHAT domain-containing protein [Micromonospora cathayae]|uniref:CHAT domain-containing protein n=1 Tax=Micromonospora cathayae TaxID=3028804 RepID=A0ABY7ZKU5_9ACTN|nr:CHAT domain-containing protein [Micromonospora sp. HUAS 3]WDZ83386.1 CHAT domain-containing protein [Micromonospora sp. HUAS 3]